MPSAISPPMAVLWASTSASRRTAHARHARGRGRLQGRVWPTGRRHRPACVHQVACDTIVVVDQSETSACWQSRARPCDGNWASRTCPARRAPGRQDVRGQREDRRAATPRSSRTRRWASPTPCCRSPSPTRPSMRIRSLAARDPHGRQRHQREEQPPQHIAGDRTPRSRALADLVEPLAGEDAREVRRGPSGCIDAGSAAFERRQAKGATAAGDMRLWKRRHGIDQTLKATARRGERRRSGCLHGG